MDGLYLNPKPSGMRQLLYNGCLRSLIVFCVVLGSVGGFLSAFDIPFSVPATAFFYLLLSVYASVLYTAPRVVYRDIGYLCFFVLFLGAIFFLRDLANSGLYEIVNAVLRAAETFFDLPGITEYEVKIDSPYLTVTVLAVFVGMLEILVLNIWIYVTMGIGWTLMITFPILLFPLYMKRSPGLFFILALAVGYLAVIIFKANGHFVSYPADTGVHMRGFQKKMPAYTQDRRSFAGVLAAAAILCAVLVALAESLMSPHGFERRFKRDELRNASSETITNFLMLGFAGLFNWYDATGGMSGGKLGGVANIRPDNQADLLVTCVSYDGQPVYLKGFTGGRYGNNEWLDLYPHEVNGGKERDEAVFSGESMRAEAERLKKNYELGAWDGAKGRMDVKNVGADEHYLYYPYYTLMPDYTVYDRYYAVVPEGIRIWQEARYSYYPATDWRSYGNNRPSETDLRLVDEVFLEVPDKNREVIAAECARIGLSGEMSANEITAAVYAYFYENIPYTRKPGATPRKEDFVNYFLTKNRRGYCAHFASAATLIFRQMGIPARYVEGYVFSEEDAVPPADAKPRRYEDYFDGYLPDESAKVRDYEVTDAMAHAWVEIYVQDFGWRAVEVTPGNAAPESGDGFWYSIANAFNDRTEDAGGGFFGALRLTALSWLVYPALAFFAAILLLRAGQLGARKLRRFRRCHRSDEREALIACYEQICEMERVCSPRFALCSSHRGQILHFVRNYELPAEPGRVCRILEEASFSTHAMAQEELRETRAGLRALPKAIRRRADLRTKLRLLLR